MARYTGPKNRLSRAEGLDLFNKGNKLRRATIKPGMNGAKRQGKQSEYAIQLRAKQRAKRLYGVLERQFSNYVKKARKSGDIRNTLVELLETRLDNVIYRLGWVPTRPAARQLVSHGHVLINNFIVKSPSYKVKTGEEVSLDKKISEIPIIKDSLEEKREVPDWIQSNELKGKITRNPNVTDLKEPISLAEIIEYYAR